MDVILNRINPDLKKVMIYESGLQAGPRCGLSPQHGLRSHDLCGLA
jgi:hypothetical protein